MAAKKKDAKQAEAETELEEGADGEDGKAAKKKLPLKLIIIAATALLVLGGGGTGAYLFFGGYKPSQAAAAAVPKPPVFLDLPDTLVNLANAGTERPQYLKVKIVLELPDQNMITQIQPIMPRVMDAFQTYLRELRPTDLDGLQVSASEFGMKAGSAREALPNLIGVRSDRLMVAGSGIQFAHLDEERSNLRVLARVCVR